jgi:hypothetical protein
MNKYPIIRTIYLYLFALVGLIMVTTGGVQLVELGLKTWVFPKADEQVRFPERPPFPFKESGTGGISEEDFIGAMKNCSENCQLSEGQKQDISDWLRDYEEFQERQKDFPQESKTQRRQRQASNALAFIIVGVPLYLYHWRVIQKDIKAKKVEARK